MSRLLCCLFALTLAIPAQGQDKAAPVAEKAAVDALGDPLPSGALLRLGTSRLRPPGSPTDIAFSTDSKLLAVATGGHAIYLYEVPSGKHRQTLQGPSNNPYRTLAFSPDSELLAAGGGFDGALLFEMGAGKQVREITAPPAGHKRLAFSPDNKWLASVAESKDDSIRLLPLTDGQPMRQLKGGGGPVYALEFSRDGKKLLAAGYQRHAEIWDVDTGKRLHVLQGGGQVTTAGFTPDSKGVVIATTGSVALWDVETGREVRRFGPGKGSNSVAVAPDGKTVALAHYQGGLHLWDLPTGKICKELEGGPRRHGSRVVFSPDGKMVAAIGSGESHVYLWDMATGKPLAPIPGHLGDVLTVAVSADGKQIASGAMDGNVLVWDAATGKEVWRLTNQGHLPISGLAFAPDGKALVSSSKYSGQSEKVWTWDLATGKELGRLGDTKHGTGSVKYVRDGAKKTLVAGSVTKAAIVFWDPSTCAEVRELPIQKFGLFSSFDITRDGRLVVTGHWDRSVRLWDVHSKEQVRVFSGYRTSVHAVVLSPNERLVASGATQDEALVWETLTGQEVLRLPGHLHRVMATAFAPDGHLLATAGSDGQVHLWDVDTGKKVASCGGHVGIVQALAFTPDGRRLITGGADSTLLVWDLKQLAPNWQPWQPPVLTAQDMGVQWLDLGGKGLPARQVVAALIAHPKLTLPLLRERLKDDQHDKIAKLVGLLDDKTFNVRESASVALRKLGRLAEPALRRALESQSLELRERAKGLLERLPLEVSEDAPSLRLLRAIEILERMDGDEARKLLAELIELGGTALLGREARAAFERLGR